MFLILGTSECKYCLESKKLLDSLSLKYTYVDLSLKFGDNWRSIFNTLKSILGTQRTIPIIFTNNTDENCDLTPEALKKAGWNLIGDFFSLKDHLDNLDISISDNY